MARAEPALGWTYLSREALARAKAQMDQESMGVRDEIGFLIIHQRYADLFFPGTSVLHTRARYALFVPWLFEDLSGLIGPTAQRELQERERLLAGRLRKVTDYLPAVRAQARLEDPETAALLRRFEQLWRKLQAGLGSGRKKTRR